MLLFDLCTGNKLVATSPNQFLSKWRCHEVTWYPFKDVFTKQISSDRSLPLQWRHNELDGVLSHQPHDCLLNRLCRRRSKKTPKLRVTGLCAGNSPVTGEFPAQMASNAEKISSRWRHHATVQSTTVVMGGAITNLTRNLKGQNGYISFASFVVKVYFTRAWKETCKFVNQDLREHPNR